MNTVINESPLCEELPYWEFESEPFPHSILWDGSLSAGLEILPLDIECFDNHRINHLTQGLRSFVNALPEGFSCQFYVKVDSNYETKVKAQEDLLSTQDGFLRNLDKARRDKIMTAVTNDQIFGPRLFLFLKTETPVKQSQFKNTKKFAAEFSLGYRERLQALDQACLSVQSSLSSLGFTIDRLDKSVMVDLLYSFFNPARAKEIKAPVVNPRSEVLGNDSPRSQLVFGDLILDKNDFVLGKMRTRMITLKTLPESTFSGMMSGFLTLPFKYELMFSFIVSDQAKEISSLEQKRRMAHSLAHSQSNRVSDLESESRLNQTTDLLREIIETGQKIFQAEMLLVLREENSNEGQRLLNLKTKEVLSQFKTLSGSEACDETVGAWKIFKSDLPLAPLSLVRGKRLKTNNLVDFLPMYGPARGDDIPTVLFNTRIGGLYSFNPIDPKLTNYNMLVTGSSGSGKSFANNFLMLQQIARGTRVYIIDVGGSYEKMTKVLGGQYFEINLSENYAINPFATTTPSEMPSGDRLKGMLAIVEQMIVDEGEKLSRLERVQLEEALIHIFENAQREKTPRSPLISDLAKYCEKSKEEALQKVGKLLFPWVGQTPFGKMLDRQGSIRADSPVVAFDLKGLSQYPDLQAVMILILTNFILDQIESDRTVSKRVLLDEAWQFLKSPAAANFMEYAARTFRKTGSGISFITQGVEEIVGSGIGPAILNNTATKLVMLQKGDTKVLSETLKLNSTELKLIQSLEQRKGLYSEGFFIAGDTRQVIRIQPSPLEYWISTSDARDNQFIKKLLGDGKSLQDALIQAAEVAPFGVAQLKGSV